MLILRRSARAHSGTDSSSSSRNVARIDAAASSGKSFASSALVASQAADDDATGNYGFERGQQA